jgi:hypothetical protein
VKRLALILLLAAACERRSPPSPRPAPPLPVAPVSPPLASPPPAAPPTGVEPQGEEELQAEERDRDPRSEKVTVKLIITPVANGTVHWGRKKLADLKPGQMKVEAERPRDSGPLDLLIRADGFLPHHVRVFTDRDDKLSVHLVRAEQASGLLGYRRPAPAP